MQPGADVCPGDILFPAVGAMGAAAAMGGALRTRAAAPPPRSRSTHSQIAPQSTHAPGPGTHADGDAVVASLVGRLAVLPPVADGGDQVSGGCA